MEHLWVRAAGRERRVPRQAGFDRAAFSLAFEGQGTVAFTTPYPVSFFPSDCPAYAAHQCIQQSDPLGCFAAQVLIAFLFFLILLSSLWRLAFHMGEHKGTLGRMTIGRLHLRCSRR